MLKAILVGMGILVVLILFSLVILQIKNKQDMSQIERSLQSQEPTQQRFDQEMIAELPAPVQRYFLHAIAPGTSLSTVVKLDMTGQFRLANNKPWLPLKAQEILTRQGFIWKAAIGSGLSQFQGADYYCDRTGHVQFALWGLVPVADVQNPNTARSAIGRLAAELMWLPAALLPQQGVQWSAIDDNMIQAHLNVDDEPVTLTLVIDANGKLLESYALRWGEHTLDRSWEYIPMGGKSYDEQTFGGFTIPAKVGAGWWFGSEQYFEFFQCTIEHAVF